MFWNKEEESRVKFNPGLSANRPSNNWALENSTEILVLGPNLRTRIWVYAMIGLLKKPL